MIDGSEKRNRQLAFEFRIRMFVKSTVREEKKNFEFKQNFAKQMFFLFLLQSH